MNNDALHAACCLAGADGEVTVEELQVLRGLVAGAGLERGAFDSRVAKIRGSEEYRREQTEVAAADVEGAMTRLIGLAEIGDSEDRGHRTMLLWRIATRLDLSAERFDELLAAGRGAV